MVDRAITSEQVASLVDNRVVVVAAVDRIEVDAGAGVCRVVSGGLHGWVLAEDVIEEVVVVRQAEVLAVAALDLLAVNFNASAQVRPSDGSIRFDATLV